MTTGLWVKFPGDFCRGWDSGVKLIKYSFLYQSHWIMGVEKGREMMTLECLAGDQIHMVEAQTPTGRL